jgi:uncharacterized damage-inducible protein DinB
MNMGKISDVLLESLKREANQTRVVLSTADGEDLDFAPKESMRKMKQLANHTAQIPHMDIAIYSGELDSGDAAQKREHNLNRNSIKEMLGVFDEGLEKMIEFFQGKSDNEMLEENLKPFYVEEGMESWAHYLSECISHLAMHKMQLWMYLKLAGVNVDMMTYYGIESH